MPIGLVTAGVAAAATVAGGVISSNGAKSAAKTQAAAADKAGNLVDQRYQQTRMDLMPYNDAGKSALTRLSAMSQPGFQFNPTDPSYAFRMAEGTRAVNTSAAARGNRLSGGTLKALTRYGQGAASQEYGAEFGRNFSLAGLGQNAAAQTGSFGANAANAQGEYGTQAANASAAGTVGQANALNNGLGSLAGIGANYAAGNFGGGQSGYQAPVLQPGGIQNLRAANYAALPYA